MRYIRILRPQQWYKNLVVFLALVYSGNLLNLSLFQGTVLGFVSLCLISSSGYILNDVLDRRYDKRHPEKSKTPIASGEISVINAVLYAATLLVIGLVLAFYLNLYFLSSMVLLFVLTLLYSIFIKHIAFLDILVIAINFVIRAVSGAYLINVYISPWLIMCPFFLSLFLSAGKRRAESLFASRFKPVLKAYTKEITSTLIVITATILILTYTLYTMSVNETLMFTLPIVLYGIFLYLGFIFKNEKVARYPFLVFKDYRMITIIVFWIIITVLVLY